MPVTIVAAPSNFAISEFGTKVYLDCCQCPRVPVRQRYACQVQHPGTWMAGNRIDVITSIALSGRRMVWHMADSGCCNRGEIAVSSESSQQLADWDLEFDGMLAHSRFCQVC